MGAEHQSYDKSRQDSGVQERSGRQLQVVIVNEHTPGNILSDPERGTSFELSFFATFSSESFAENPPGQKRLADFYINQLGLRGRGNFLDVGFGGNIHISNGFSEQGIVSFAIDTLTVGEPSGDPRSNWHAPLIAEKTKEGVTLVSGDVAALGEEDSDLDKIRFGTILFNGSWEAAGNNFTVGGEVLEAKKHVLENTEPYFDYLDRERSTILTTCRDHLTDNGVIGVISSRYANHGGGYGFDQYPQEKLSFIDLYARFVKLGATKITVVGLSQAGVDRLIDVSRSRMAGSDSETTTTIDQIFRPLSREQQLEVQRQLRSSDQLDPAALVFDIGRDSNFDGQINRLQEAIGVATRYPQLDSVARIDAMFAEFPKDK